MRPCERIESLLHSFVTGQTLFTVLSRLVNLWHQSSKRIKNARLLLIPGSADTFGHGTTAFAKFWKKDLADLLQLAPRVP